MLRGSILAIVEELFPTGLPSLQGYAQEASVAPSTFRRTAAWLLGILPGLLKERRPGPQPAEEESATPERQAACSELEALKLWLLEQRAPTEKNNCYSAEAKQKIAHLSAEIQKAGTLDFGEIAQALGMDERQLLRIRVEVKAAGGGPPEPQSRRPKDCQELAAEIQQLIGDIQASAHPKNPYTATDIKRILEAKYQEQLRQHHGAESIALDTVSKYMKKAPTPAPEEPRRGAFHYPEPFQQVALDTTHFKLFGRTFYFLTVFELAGRLNLLTRVFLKENTAAVVQVVEEYLSRYPDVEAAVIDRGSPYLNAEVKELLTRNGRLRIVAPPATPTAKAALERHFETLKSTLRPALASVFTEDPGWEPEKLTKLLAFGVAVFQALYHQIPQEGIDGKSPAERIERFDPVRACAAKLELFKRALESEPAEEYARELHRRFQFPGSEAETVRRLRPFGTRALRQALEEVKVFMGPPFPGWMWDPVGFLAVRARECREREERAYRERQFREEVEKERREAAQESAAQLAAERREQEEHPERFIDSTLATLLGSLSKNFPGGVRLMSRRLKELLAALARKLGAAFESELRRLKRRVRELCSVLPVQERADQLLDGLAQELGFSGGGP